MAANLFRIGGFIDEKHLGAWLRFAASVRVLNVDTLPVTNAVKGKSGELSAETGGSLVERVVAKLDPKNPPDTTKLKSIITMVGGNPTSAGYIAQQLVQAKVLKRAGKRKGGEAQKYAYGSGYGSQA